MFSIGEFSRITGLTVKTLRLYHEKGLLIPRTVDPYTNYRYYDRSNVEQARAVRYLRELMLPLDKIKQILDSFNDDAEALKSLREHREQVLKRVRELKTVADSMEQIIEREEEALRILEGQEFQIEEKVVEDVLIAGIRWKGKYSDTGTAFARLFKRTRGIAVGKAFNLYYDEGYMEEGADIESCVCVREKRDIEGVNIRTLEGGRGVSLVYKGPYDQIHLPYARLIEYVKCNAYRIRVPGREIYLKGPGVIFRGNPMNYLTEIQLLVEEGKADGKDRL